MNVGGLQSHWFTYSNYTLSNGKQLPMATLKPEFIDEVRDHYEKILKTPCEPSARKELSEDQLKYLQDKYDGAHMTYDEYQAFLDDLVDMDVLTEADTYKVGGAIEIGGDSLTPVIPLASISIRDESTAATSPVIPLFPSYSLPSGSEKADITEWAKYRATFDKYYFGSAGRQYKSNEGELFQTVSDILSKI